MPKGLERSLSRGARSDQDIIKDHVTITGMDATLTHTGGGGYLAIELGELPNGWLRTLAILSKITITRQDTNISATFSGEYGVGTVAANADTDLSDTAEDNILPDRDIDAAVAGVAAETKSLSVQALVSNIDNDKTMYLNIVVPTGVTADADLVIDFEMVAVYATVPALQT